MIKSKKDYKYYLECDRKALQIEKPTFGYRIREFILPDPVWKFERLLRKCEYIINTKRWDFRKYYFLWRFRKMSVKLGFNIGLNVFGPGLSIAHWGTIIVNSNARVGRNCRIHPCCHLVASGGMDEALVLGDNVMLGIGAVIVGDVHISDNVIVGANSTVTEDCLRSNVVLVGSPAKVVKTCSRKWWEINGWDLVY